MNSNYNSVFANHILSYVQDEENAEEFIEIFLEMIDKFISETISGINDDVIYYYLNQSGQYMRLNVVENFSISLLILLKNITNQSILIKLIAINSTLMVKIQEMVLINQNTLKIKKLLSNLFLKEFKDIISKIELELFIQLNEIYSKLNTESIDLYPKYVYKRLLDFLLEFDLNYDYLQKIQLDEDLKYVGKQAI